MDMAMHVPVAVIAHVTNILPFFGGGHPELQMKESMRTNMNLQGGAS